MPAAGELTAGALAGPLGRVLADRVELVPPRRAPAPLTLLAVGRTPYFCSGCPHNRSTVVSEGSVAGGGIGCHAMVALTDRPESEVSSITQMGGEGAQWIGQATYIDARHMFQNMGDGTFAHSGQLAVQACVAAGVSITYKLLFNRAVAMTGGQDAAGGLEVPQLASKLLAEGVAKIIVCADEPERFGDLAPLPRDVDLWSRDRLSDAQRVLAETPGVTVLVYDQRCAAESRRLRKRGAIPVRTTRVVINEAVCEGCGDCGVKSNCLSVQPVETELGRKTRIDQTSCNTDYSCLAGDCPSFVTVEAGSGGIARSERPEPPSVPDVERPAAGDVFLAGIGGAGIVTVNQVLGSAALRDGFPVHGVDQTGLSQKAGPVTSHLRIARDPAVLGPANRVGTAGCYLAFDVLVGADARYLGYADPASTLAVVSTSPVPTGSMVRDPGVAAPAVDALVERIADRSRAVVALDAQAAANVLFGDAMPANLLIVGAAYQAGALPVSAAAIEWAIELNGVAVVVNTAAFRWGRVAVADPAAFAAATAGPVAQAPPTWTELGELRGRPGGSRASGRSCSPTTRTRARPAVTCATSRPSGGPKAFSEAVARGLHKLTAYMDEYEVARLLTEPAFEARLAAEVPRGTGLRYRLHPPTLKALGAFGPWMRPVLQTLARGKALRGTPLDPFGQAPMRRLERALRDEYRAMVLRLAAELTAKSYATAVAVAATAELVRGYEDVKLAGVRRYRARLAELGLAARARKTSL